jgi:hypothetical protein
MNEVKITIEEYRNLIGIAYFCKYSIDIANLPSKERLQILLDELSTLEQIKSERIDKMLNR